MLQKDTSRTTRASSEERIKKLKATLHSLATRIPVIGLKRVEDVYPSLQYSMTIHVTSAVTDDTIVDEPNLKRRRGASLKLRTSLYLICQRCQKSYINQESFDTHDCKLHTCNICNKNFPYYSALKRHSFSHSKLRPCMCDKCDKSFRCERDLLQHVRMAHDDKKMCKHCGKVFSKKSNLINHRKTHNVTNKMRSVTNSEPQQGTDENITHSDSGFTGKNDKHICEHCGKVFTKKNTLSNHRKTHDVKDKMRTVFQKVTNSESQQGTDKNITHSDSGFTEKNSQNMEQQDDQNLLKEDLVNCSMLQPEVSDNNYTKDHIISENSTLSQVSDKIHTEDDNIPENSSLSDVIQEKKGSESSEDSLTNSESQQGIDENITHSDSGFTEKNSENMAQQDYQNLRKEDLVNCSMLQPEVSDNNYTEDHFISENIALSQVSDKIYTEDDNIPENSTLSDVIQEKKGSESSEDNLKLYTTENLADMSKLDIESNLKSIQIETCQETTGKNSETSKPHLEQSSEADDGTQKILKQSSEAHTGTQNILEQSTEADIGKQKILEQSLKADTGAENIFEQSCEADTGAEKITEQSSEADTGTQKIKFFLDKTIEEVIRKDCQSIESYLEKTKLISENLHIRHDLNVEKNSEGVTQNDCSSKHDINVEKNSEGVTQNYCSSTESYIEKTNVQEKKRQCQPLQLISQENLNYIPAEFKNNCSSSQIICGGVKHVFESDDSFSLEQSIQTRSLPIISQREVI